MGTVTLHLSECFFLSIAVYNKRIPKSRFSKVLPNFAHELLTASLQITVYGSNIPHRFSFITTNVNTFVSNSNKISLNELNRVKIVLVEQKKTGKCLAEQLGDSVTITSFWCFNSVQPDLQALSKIAKLLKVETRELLVPTDLHENF